MKEQLIKQLESYIPYNEQEEKDKELILTLLHSYNDIFFRSNPLAHMTASAWIVNKDRSKTLMAYHNIYHSWAWLGGHADGNENLLQVALKEVAEESGITHLFPVTDEIFSLEVLTVDGHEKRGEYLSSHLHLNLTYLIEADEADPLFIKEDENSGVAWFSFEEALAASNEEWFKKRIYSKLMEKVRKNTL